MKVHIITIFPESFDSYFSSSIMRIAQEKKQFEPCFYKLSDYSDRPTKRVDDKAFWMHGQVLSPEPLSKAIDGVFDEHGKMPVIYLSPRGELLNQEAVEKFSEVLSECVIICWHYEWIDQRIIDFYVDYEVSIWEYVITSWELATMVFLDTIVRHLPWVLNSDLSVIEESFSEKLGRQKEYPVYTRPRSFKWMDVPDEIISWDHSRIEQWKKRNIKS